MIVLAVAFLVAAKASSRSAEGVFVLIGLTSLPGWAVLFRAYGLYHRGLKRVSHSAIDDLPALFHAVLVGSLLIWILFKLALPADQLVLVEVVVFAAVTAVGALASRSLVKPTVSRLMGA